ncbi:MAG: DNA recombination protein RmuC [Clostridiales bacterium]|nr:DNA recombination protein RmuC [Clostridiales bacterium]
MIEYIILALIVVLIIIGIINIVSVRQSRQEDDDESEQEMFDKLINRLDENKETVKVISGQFDLMSKNQYSQNRSLQDTIAGTLKQSREEQSARIDNLTRSQNNSFVEFRKEMNESADRQNKSLMEVQKITNESLNKLSSDMSKTLQDSIKAMTESNEKKLDEIRGVVNEKLDKTLNERLDTNFKQVGEQMANLYKSLGELQQLSAGVTSLNRTISNVKTRGNWGEVQLGRILEQILAPGQYEENVATKKGSSDRVEFAVRLPRDREDGNDLCLLPIDAKFPADIYNRIAEAADNADEPALKEARSELKERIRNEASKISDKYLDPPNTSDYAIMYLPTEGLYAEVLRINGLSEECQKKKVMIAGPTTIMALLNTISVGFRQMAINQKSEEIRKVLEATKAQIDKLEKAADDAQKKMDTAYKATAEIQNRTRIMRKKMKGIATIDSDESDRILGIDSGDDIDFGPDEV